MIGEKSLPSKPVRLLFAGMLVSIVLLACGGGEHEEEPAPEMEIPMQAIDGQIMDYADYAGQPLLINFWASWCGPCRIEMPELQAFYIQNSDSVVMLSVNRAEPVEQAVAYIEGLGLSLPVRIDMQDRLYHEFGLRGMPATVLLNANGDVLWAHNGLVNQELLEEVISDYLD